MGRRESDPSGDRASPSGGRRQQRKSERTCGRGYPVTAGELDGGRLLWAGIAHFVSVVPTPASSTFRSR
jgi:hypothetical protein